MEEISYDDFRKIDIRVGKILTAENFPEARSPAYILTIDFGEEIGVKKSSSQITDHYSINDLAGRLVFGVVNFPPRQVGPIMSEVLTLGIYREDKSVILAVPDDDVPLGSKLL